MKIATLILFTAALSVAAPIMAQDGSIAPPANSGFGESLFGFVPVPGFGDPAEDEAKALSDIAPAAGDDESEDVDEPAEAGATEDAGDDEAAE